jgi:hypothetical protein
MWDVITDLDSDGLEQEGLQLRNISESKLRSLFLQMKRVGESSVKSEVRMRTR